MDHIFHEKKKTRAQYIREQLVTHHKYVCLNFINIGNKKSGIFATHGGLSLGEELSHLLFLIVMDEVINRATCQTILHKIKVTMSVCLLWHLQHNIYINKELLSINEMTMNKEENCDKKLIEL